MTQAATSLKCFRCGHMGADVKTIVEASDLPGAFHIFNACSDAEACRARLRAKAQESNYAQQP